MVKSRKPWVFAALLFLAIGVILITVAFYSVGFHVSGFNTVNYEPELTPLDRPYDKIIMDGASCDVIIMTPQTRSAFPEYQDLEITSPCVLSYNDGNSIFTECGYRDRVLYITRRDLRPWYERIGYDFRTESEQIVLFLDDMHFDALEVQSASGNIWLYSAAEIKQVQFESTSGELFAKDLTSDSLTMKTTSGNVCVWTSNSEHILLQTTSGDVMLDHVHTGDTFHAMTVSGEISAAAITSQNTLTLETTSGDISFTGLDAANGPVFETTSGDIEGSLSTGKRFSVKCISGDVEVPADVPHAPLCVIQSTSGDIEITIE